MRLAGQLRSGQGPACPADRARTSQSRLADESSWASRPGSWPTTLYPGVLDTRQRKMRLGLAAEHPGAEVDVGRAGNQVGGELLELRPGGRVRRRLEVGELGPHQDQVVALDLRLHDTGALTELRGDALLRGERHDDLLRPGGRPGLARHRRGAQVDHADGAHHLVVTRDVA